MRAILYGDRKGAFLCGTCLALMMVAQRLCAQPFAGAPPAELPDAPQARSTPMDTGKDAQKKGCPPGSSIDTGRPGAAPANGLTKATSASCAPKFDILYPLGKPPRNGPLSSMDKLRIAASDVVDPFNLITIGASAAITIGSNSHSDYGPGMKGWAKNSGVLLTEDMTGAFFTTFLVPSLTGQDPRYHRMPKASIPRRAVNVLTEPVWTLSDKGDHMLNYGNLIGIPCAITLANVYAPGRKQGVWPTAESSAIAIASSPIDNFISEFLPDVAKHVSIHIVLIQRIVNHIALTGGPV